MGEINPFEVAERFREAFPYLMEVPISEQEYKTIERFDQFIKSKMIELDLMRTELKGLLTKCVPEHRAEGKIY